MPGDPHVRHALGLPTIAGVAAGGVGLVAALVFLRFCGEVTMPPKPPPPRFDDSPEKVADDLRRSNDVYLQAVARDAQKAGLPRPTDADVTRAFTWRSDATRRVLAPGAAPIEVAGLRLSAIKHRHDGSEPLLSLVIENPAAAPVAYLVETAVSSGDAACLSRTLLAHNGNVVAAGGREVRSECEYKRGAELYVVRVESAEVTPLAAYYLSLVPPRALGGAPRVALGHKPALPAGVVTCNVSVSQSVVSALEDGDLRWRDLADFYARHSCATYQFPDGYRAFEADGERPLPVVGD